MSFELGTEVNKLWLVQGLLCTKIDHIRKIKTSANVKPGGNSDFITPMLW